MIPEKAEEVYYFPLSFSQQRLWFLDQISPGNPFYNIALSIPLKVPIRLDILEQSINLIIQRHEALRTNFISDHGEPLQVVHEHIAINIALAEYQITNDIERSSIVAREYSREVSYSFDLQRDMLVKAKLLKFGAQDYFFIVTMHHIISDGWSLRIFWDELIKIYNSLSSDRDPSLDEIVVQYGDYAIWQREWLKGDILNQQLSFWKNQLIDIQTLQLVNDKPRPAVLTYQGAFEPIRIPQALSTALRNISQQQGVTMFMTMLTAFAILLHRYTLQKSIAIGSPVAGRSRVELEGLIGFFINTLVMKIDIDPDCNFIDLLQQTKKTTVEAFAHQDLPFERLVEELHLDRDLSRNPLFQVTFQLLSSVNGKEQAKTGKDKNEIKLERGVAIFDIALNLVDMSEGIEGHFEYSTDLFNEDTIRRMAANYKSLMIEIVSNPQKKIVDFSSLTKNEYEQIISTWNDNDRLDLLALPCVHYAFEKNAKEFPDALAVYSEERSYTYRELNDKANQLAHYLIKNGIGSEILVGVCIDRSPEMIIAWLSILKTGGAYVPMDTSNPPERLLSIVEQTRMPVLITIKKYADKIVPGIDTKLLFIEDAWKIIDGESKVDPGVIIQKENRAYIIFTSGSTGVPKGVEITHNGLANLCYWHISHYSVTASDRATQLANPAFDASTWEVWPYLAAGAAICVIDEETKLDPTRLVKKIREQSISFCFIPTAVAEIMLEDSDINKTKLKALFTGGDWLKQYPSDLLNFQLVNHYGPTENSVVATCAVIDKPGDTQAFPPIGKPIANVKAYILNDHFQPVPIGGIGELFIGGEGLARCYFNAPELTALSFIPDPFSLKGGERLYRTGDRARYLADGNIEFHGRKDSQVKIRGFRIELQEIESKLLQFEEIKEAAVLVHESESGSKQLVAFLTSLRETIVKKDVLRQYMSSQLPSYMIPDNFVVLENFPITPNGKIDKKSLLKSYLPSELYVDSFAEPSNPLEMVITSIWEEVLHKDQIGINHNFFTDLGGHSLLATQLISRLRSTLNVEIPLQRIFEAPTIAQFASSLIVDPLEKMRIERTAQILLNINSMSDEELESMLTKSKSTTI